MGGPSQSRPAPILLQSAHSCQRPSNDAGQKPAGFIPSASAGYPCAPQICVQTVQPQSQPFSIAMPPQPIAAPVQADFGLGAASTPPVDSITQIEVTLVASDPYHVHK